MVMAAMATARAWLAVKPHRPLIKFRKGGGVAGHEAGGVQAARSGHPQSVGAGRAPIQPKPILEDWQMPRKYQRLAITEEEIEYINTGGPPPK
ncbi:hypothetical protein J437_LFUL003473 [Ladona fulva]|uniref:Uncharacterized protein n=1 Tax=Ladona fulva TaxID=123851 RepID=A0A8K0NW41_LADFU|nr:hypothetical protein J437_LFUL003473 [Ladona fulva]